MKILLQKFQHVYKSMLISKYIHLKSCLFNYALSAMSVHLWCHFNSLMPGYYNEWLYGFFPLSFIGVSLGSSRYFHSIHGNVGSYLIQRLLLKVIEEASRYFESSSRGEIYPFFIPTLQLATMLA